MNYLDGFSGYGGFHLAFEQAGWKFDNVYYSEIDKYAIANYKYNYPESIYAGSITDIPTNGVIEKLDLFTFGWPCQDNSIAGKRKGQSGGTRSGLLHSAIKVINKYKPGVFVAENVAGLYSVNKGIDIIESFKLLSFLNESMPQYDIEMQLLNTRWFLPQNRERLFFIGHLRGGSSRQIFPIGESDFRANERATNTLIVRCFTAGGHSGGMHSGMTLVRSLQGNDTMPTIRSSGHGSLTNKHAHSIIAIRGRESGQEIEESKGDYTNTLTSVQKDNLVITDNLYASQQRDYVNESPILTSNLADRLKINHIRRLTPIEVERLQGLPDNHTKFGIFEKQVWINKKEKTFKIIEGIQEISDSQRYKLVGNGVSIPPVKLIAEKLKRNYSK